MNSWLGKQSATTTSGSAKTSEATSTKSPKSDQKMSQYFHGEIRREFVDDLLKEDGDFLIRSSSQGSLAVSVKWKGSILHYQPAILGNGAFSFGNLGFKTVDELVVHHWTKSIPLCGEMKAILKKPIRHHKVTFKKADVEVVCKLGEGNFGDVFKVKIKSEDKFYAMKTLRGNVSKETREAFVKEMEIMATMRHENVVQCVGTVEDESEVRILLELINNGSMDKLLRKGKLTERGKGRILLHVARGLAYLHRHLIIHRDLAARNILVHRNEDNTLTAKVSDFGLSRKDENGKGYELRTAQKLPMKWLAPECFTKRLWTLASDVWSFGILMWEVFTNGKDPYYDLGFPNMQALAKHIAAGGHPSHVSDANRELHAIMLLCWTVDVSQRPTMDHVLAEIEKIYPNIKNSDSLTSSATQRSITT